MNHDPTNWTFLTKRNKRWRRLPPETQKEICQGVENVRRIRAQIAADAVVKVMPPVEILDEIWTSADGESLINGRTAPVIIDGQTRFGAQLPVSTPMLPDDELIRGILVHEFAHCFFNIVQFVNALDAGYSGSELQLGVGDSSTSMDRAHDDALLVDPAAWFGLADAKALMHWDDKRWSDENLEAQAVIIEMLSPWLPVKSPQLNFKIQGLTYNVEVANHVRKLRVLDGNR